MTTTTHPAVTEYVSNKYQHNHDIQPSLLFKELNPDCQKDPQLKLNFADSSRALAKAKRCVQMPRICFDVVTGKSATTMVRLANVQDHLKRELVVTTLECKALFGCPHGCVGRVSDRRMQTIG